MIRTLAALFVTLVLWALVAQLNHELAAVHVYLFVGGLVVTVSALVLPLRSGLAGSFCGGLVFDSVTPVAFGTHALLFATAHAFVFHLRDRLPRDDTTGRVVIALCCNLAVFLGFSFLQISRSAAPATAWPRLIADLIASQLFLALVAPWFFALQRQVLIFTQTAPERIR